MALAILSTAVFSAITASAANKIYYDGEWHTYIGNFFKLKINNEIIDCEVPPIVFDDYSVVPARDVFEKLGANVLWNGENEQVTVNYDNTEIILYINNKTAYRQGKAEKMPIAPKLINGKTMIPVRYVSESLGFDVNFDSKTDTISIVSTKTVSPTYSATLKSYSYKIADSGVSATFNLSSKDVKYSVFTLSSPDRLVIDFTDTKMGNSIKNGTLDSNIVSQIRFGQHDDALRVVFDLSGIQTYKASLSGTVFTVVVGSVIADSNISTPNGNDNTSSSTTDIVIEPSRSITIDPGHGGSDPGACYTDENGKVWRETDINLAVSLKVRDILVNNGVRVVMTRTTEKDVVRKSRPELANSEKTALFLSIHTNSVADNETANGIETWGSLETSKPLSGVTDKTFAKNIQNAVIKSTKATDRGIKNSVELTVLKYSVMPSVLIEVGFITNENERGNMFNESYRDKLAQGIAEGVLKTFQDMGV